MMALRESEWPPVMLRAKGDRTTADTWSHESAEEYAQRRANETGNPYIISNLGHVLLDCRTSRSMLRRIRCRVVRKVIRNQPLTEGI